MKTQQQPTEGNPSSNKEPPPTLHHLDSSQSLRVLWALEELSPMPYNLKLYKRIQARAPPELKTVNPLGKSPVLTIENDDGKAPITVLETRLILQYISDNYSNGLWTQGQTTETRARDQYWTEFAGASFWPSLTLPMIFELIPGQVPALVRPLMGLVVKGSVPKILAEVEGSFKLIEEALAEYPWFSGSTIGLADFIMSWPFDLAVQRGYVDEKRNPKAMAWLKRVHERPAYKRALEKGGDYDLKNFGLGKK